MGVKGIKAEVRLIEKKIWRCAKLVSLFLKYEKRTNDDSRIPRIPIFGMEFAVNCIRD